MRETGVSAPCIGSLAQNKRVPITIKAPVSAQVFLETQCFYMVKRPPTNVDLSVSNVGSAPQVTAIKQLATTLNRKVSAAE